MAPRNSFPMFGFSFPMFGLSFPMFGLSCPHLGLSCTTVGFGRTIFGSVIVALFLALAALVSLLLRGTLVNRTYGTHKNLYISLFLRTLFGPIYYSPS